MRGSDVSGVQEWLLRTPHVDDGGVSFMRGLVEELRVRGLPLSSCSQAFVDALAPPGVVALGEHALKGVRTPLRVFTLASAPAGTPPGGDDGGP